ncbi:XRE family transcriptional regulator [Zhongshania marina]|uniref:XRE family transcriptional regulator n=1 Tax=Zhongshania marina TaxID=2304603 RepID=A0A2S4HEE5_9GAMM|nr:helix-turn-helix transcriptional regulator [Marortus luteolus]POP52299.1 XRE family transcriptional regulator [Marortus luteolus]
MADCSPLPRRLLEARTLKGISQKRLGILLGMEPSSASGRMNHYEKGRHTPDYPTLKRIAAELGVPVTYFFCESDVVAEIVCQLERLTESEKRVLLSQLKSRE